MIGLCEVPGCKAPARYTIELGVEAERAEVCPKHATRLSECGGKRLLRVEVAS